MTQGSQPIVSCRGVGRRYGPVVALKGADLDLAAGRVTAIVGENGAGKSTLAKIVAGVIQPDEGEIRLGGQPVRLRSRQAAMAAGIDFVPQALSFVGTLSALENYYLGEPGFQLDRAGAIRRLEAASAEIGMHVPLDVPVERLSLAERQLAEIIAAVAHGARILLLDEPTSALGPLEVEALVAAIRRLAAAGIAIGLVTHRVSEVLSGADEVTVLRAGAVVFSGETGGIDADGVAQMMVGARSRAKPALPPIAGEEIRLAVEDLSMSDNGATLLDRIRFTIRAGEIVGLAGVAGTSQPALARGLAGLASPSGGHVLLDGIDITGNAADATARGLAYIPDERSEGLVPHRSVADNAVLLRLAEPAFRAFGLRRPAAEQRHATEIIEGYGVKPKHHHIAASDLSGGNQQKLLVGLELHREPGVVIAHGPTQGLDLAAASEIRGKLVAAAARGAAVLVISADLDEILDMSHRILVLAGGRITGDFDLTSAPVDMVALGRAMAGKV